MSTTDTTSAALLSLDRTRRSVLQQALLVLLLVALVLVGVGTLALRSSSDALARHDNDSHVVLDQAVKVRIGVDDLIVELTSVAQGNEPTNQTRVVYDRLVAVVEVAAGRVAAVAEGDSTLVVFSELDTQLSDVGRLLTPNAGGSVPSWRFAAAANRIAEVNTQLNAGMAAVMSSERAVSSLPVWLVALVAAAPPFALLVLLSLHTVMGRDLTKAHRAALVLLHRASVEQERDRRLTVAQSGALELVASGASKKIIDDRISELVTVETNGSWSVGPTGLTPNSGTAQPMMPDLASTVDRVVALTTERDRINADLVYEASHDGLTGLHNRAAVVAHIDKALTGRDADDQQLAVLYFDLDGFKHVNDTYGHSGGDKILREVANRLRAAVRQDDYVGRVGGDEFVAVLYPTTPFAAVSTADRIISTIDRPYRVEDLDVRIGASLGISFAGGGDSDTLIREADHAMYRAKQSRCGVVVMDDDMRRVDVRRGAVERRITEALHDQEILVVYQPIVDTATGRLIGVEALARISMDGQVLPPSEFIGIAERSGQIVELDRRVLAVAARRVCDWNRHHNLSLRLSVNMSAVNINRPDALEDLQSTLRESGFLPGLLTVEINEAVFVQDVAGLSGRIDEARDTGIRFSIDDFGTGFSSFSYLHQLPVDELKIDKAFISGMCGSKRRAAIVRSIVDVAEALELNVVAEGVEKPEQLRILRRLGCPQSQGFFFSPPLTPAALEMRWLPNLQIPSGLSETAVRCPHAHHG